jgi:hypothetical protein
LENVKAALAKRFPNTNVHIRNPAVVVPFGSGHAERHEITPGYFIEKVDGYNVYGISNRAGGWMRTSPNAHGAWINDINDNLSKKLKPLIRFMKLWNFKRSGGIRSFYLELRTGEYAQWRKHNHLFHRHARDTTALAQQGPRGDAGPDENFRLHFTLHGCRKAGCPIEARHCHRSSKAREAESDGRISQAFDYWKMVFDGYFPDYG